jgi:hypothetical protein
MRKIFDALFVTGELAELYQRKRARWEKNGGIKKSARAIAGRAHGGTRSLLLFFCCEISMD